jgi:TonB family protein
MFSDLDEIVFENRNKEYGSYLLRKKYSRYIFISTFISITLCSAVVIISFFASKSKVYSDGILRGQNYVELSVEHLDFPKEKLSTMPETEMMTFIPKIVNESSMPGLSGAENDKIYEYDDFKESTSHGLLESRPSFQGGDIQKFINWVLPYLKYPEEAFKNRIQGAFKVFYVIEKDGSLTNIKVEPRADRSIDKEIKRVLSSSPKWIPGMAYGKSVRVQCEIPISFKIR